jgi:hypothetical protein
MIRLKVRNLLLATCALALANLACYLFPFDWSQWDFSKPPEESISSSEIPERWDVNRCDALEKVEIKLGDFSEETFINNDGTVGGTECAYTHQVDITGNQPVILFYFDHFYYGDNQPPNDYEFGWQKTAPLQPGGSWSLQSFASSYPNQPLYLDLIYSLAVIYDSPECAWLTSDGIWQEILEIADEQSLQPPCQLISPFNDSQVIPNLSQGLSPQ